ncbi:hypothetical protein TorRG33x02_109380 [Trema orientale]|uniref:Uncharacterized protein n=1 Tax=Trema orientale TaxID=63057 RepID=A0A2P5F6E7_TREOI|nr:hypothetical protein TorRG33x02_109380 [Trema orientale]
MGEKGGAVTNQGQEQSLGHLVQALFSAIDVALLVFSGRRRLYEFGIENEYEKAREVWEKSNVEIDDDVVNLNDYKLRNHVIHDETDYGCYNEENLWRQSCYYCQGI